FGYPIDFKPGFASVPGGHRLGATRVEVPADFSSAAFFVVAASIIPGSDLVLRSVGVSPRRTGLLQVLRLMGVDTEETGSHAQDAERVAELRGREAQLTGIEVPATLVSDTSDEFPALFVAAACGSGCTVVRGAAELRVKESDRIGTMAA